VVGLANSERLIASRFHFAGWARFDARRVEYCWLGKPAFYAARCVSGHFHAAAGHTIVSPGFSGFAGSAVFLTKILSRVDIFFLWNAILLIIGFGIADGLPRNKAIIGW